MAVGEVIEGFTARTLDMKAGECACKGQQALTLPAPQRVLLRFLFRHDSSLINRDMKLHDEAIQRKGISEIQLTGAINKESAR